MAGNFFRSLKPNAIVAFTGDLGAGKTSFIKGMLASQLAEEEIQSPTFVYLNVYPCTPIVYHFDLYRLKSAEEFLSMGFDEYFEKEGICLLEWADRIKDILPPHTQYVHLEGTGNNPRKIWIK